MEIGKELNNYECILSVSGVLDFSTMGPFVEEIHSIEEGIKKVIVDFKDLEFIDSTGIGAIINLVHEARAKQFDVEIQGVRDEIEELFEMIGVFQILETLQEESD